MFWNNPVLSGIQASQGKMRGRWKESKKIAVRLIMGDQTEYKESLNVLKLTTLTERRNLLSVTFAKKCLANQKTKKHICKKH